MSVEERDRLAELRDALDRKMSRRGIPTHRQAVQVYDGGSIPTTVPKMFLSHPIGIDCDEAEGASVTFTPDISQEIPVLVLGPAVPVAGDNLLAVVIGGRWVAGKQQGSATTTCGHACAACGGVFLSPLGDSTRGSGLFATQVTYYGTVTDSQGTWPIDWLSGTFAPNVFQIPVTIANRSIHDPGSCSTFSAKIPYLYLFVCELDGSVSLELHADTVNCGGLIYYTGQLGVIPIPTDSAALVATATPSCAGGTLSATFTFGNLSGGDAPPGGTSVVVSLNIDDGTPRVCCEPCPIPRRDLTLSYQVDGGAPTVTTLVYNSGAETWGDGTNTLACAGGNSRFTDVRGDHTTIGAATCSPYHVVFVYTTGGHTYTITVDD